MSILKFELKEEHVLLLKHLKWSDINGSITSSLNDVGNEPILNTATDKYEYINLVLNGAPNDFDALNDTGEFIYTEEQKELWDKLYSELPMALDIILYFGGVEYGKYKTRHHIRDWKKI